MKKQNTKTKIITSLIWRFMERGGTYGIQFIVQIVLARLLMPEDYGLVALVTIFITIANVFVQKGFNTALIQKKEVDEVDYASVFYISLIVSGILYVLLFFSAPYISTFYNRPQLTPVFRVLTITLFFGAFHSIQNAVIARNMQFKKLFFSSVGAIIISGTIGILMAYMGYGVWALVAQQLFSKLTITTILWFTVEWRPKWQFSFHRIKGLFSYGWKILLSSLIYHLYMDIRGLIIGKMYSPVMLGYFNRGKQFPQFIITNVNDSIQSVMFPVLSAKQDDKQRVKQMVRRSIVTSSFVLFPMMIGLVVIAEPLVRILLTEKWLPAVPFLQIFCFSYALWPLHTSNLQSISALGRSDIFLKLEIIKTVIGVFILGLSLRFGVYAIASSVVVVGLISTVIDAYPNEKLLGYGFKEQWRDIMPTLILSVLMGLVIYPLKFLELGSMYTMSAQIIAGAVFYIGFAYVFKFECFLYLIKTVKEFYTS